MQTTTDLVHLPTLRKLVDEGRASEIPLIYRRILFEANDRALVDLSIAVSRAQLSDQDLVSRQN